MLNVFSRFSVFLGILGICSMSVAGGATHYQAGYTSGTQANQSSNGSRLQSLAPFNNLVIAGNVKVSLSNSSSNTIRFLNGPIPSPLNLSYQGNTLTISSPLIKKPTLNGPVLPAVYELQMNVSELNQLSTSGNAIVTGRFNSQALTLNSAGNSQINLDGGVINLQQLTASNNSHIKVYWVNSPNLILTGTGSSVIKLAGTAQVIHASLSDKSQMNGQYLRAQQALIQTNNHAFVSISATQALRAFAANYSNIFYYKYPRSFTEYDLKPDNIFQSGAGNVLQVDWRS